MHLERCRGGGGTEHGATALARGEVQDHARPTVAMRAARDGVGLRARKLCVGVTPQRARTDGPDAQSLRIGTVLGATGQLDGPAVETLEALSQHWAVDLSAKTGSDVHDAAWIDAQDVAVVGEMVNRA